MKIANVLVVLLLLSAAQQHLSADESPVPDAANTAPDAANTASIDQAELYKLFEQKMSGVKLVGRFTILGKEDADLPREEYTINSVKKLPDGDYWLFNARIQYGDKDHEFSLPLEVKWAGTTPVITLTDFTIPAMGTFSSRVIIYQNKYSGTWTHGKVGGHLFGVIEKLDAKEGESN
jgi:hypothetical protein